jgi:hypothetical protein
MPIFSGLVCIISICATLYVCSVNPMFGLLCVLVLIMGIVWFFSKEGRD